MKRYTLNKYLKRTVLDEMDFLENKKFLQRGDFREAPQE